MGETEDFTAADHVATINNYVGKTILTLDMAYSNARLITRPDSDWLLSDIISNDNTQGV